MYVAESDDIAGYSVAPKAEALAAVVEQASPAAVLLSSSSENKEIAARLALKVEGGLLYDAVGIDGDGNVTQQIFGASITVTAKVSKGTPVITVRPNSFAPGAVLGRGRGGRRLGHRLRRRQGARRSSTRSSRRRAPARSCPTRR